MLINAQKTLNFFFGTFLGCSGLVYSKSVRLLKSAAEEGQNGTIINLLSNDLAKFDIGLAFLHDGL